MSTFLSEDLTCVAAGILAGQGRLQLPTALAGCYAGIVIGDGLLWLLGRSFGRQALTLPVLRRVATPDKIARAERWFRRNGLLVVLASRFLPGTRFPTFLCAGMLGTGAKPFMLLALSAGLVWTPFLVWLGMNFGLAAGRVFGAFEEHPFLTLVAGVATLAVLFQGITLASSRVERKLFRARWGRRLRWEFLPPWALYLPLAPWFLALALRHRGLRTVFCANPAMPFGGFAGESKAAILRDLDLPPENGTAFLFVPAGGRPEERAGRILAWKEEQGLPWPLIVKPDVGQRGRGVRRAGDEAELLDALEELPVDVLAQEYVDLPEEYGVFWVDDPRDGPRILSITLKEFPCVAGDGRRSLEDLILDHPRLRFWAERFFLRLGDRIGEVPAAGERVALGIAGNHAQGTTFRDGTSLATPELAAAIEALARRYRDGGFHFGRFDLRAPSREAFQRGEGLRVLELNGVTSEATHIYDPERSLLQAWRDLGRQWALAWRIGAGQRRKGHRPESWGAFLRALLRAHRLLRRLPRT